MSSPRAATKARRPAANGKPKAAAKVCALPSRSSRRRTSSRPRRSGSPREIERQFAKSEDALSVEAMQALMSALCRIYSAQVENGAKFTPIPEGQVVSPTGVMLTASGLLRAANLAVFELGMWQSWTGR